MGMDPVSPTDLTMGGVAVAAVSMAVKVVVEALRTKTTTASDNTELFAKIDRIERELEDLRGSISKVLKESTDSTLLVTTALAELDLQSEELLRMHRDPNSNFSSSETNRLLNEVLRSMSSLRAELNVRGEHG